LRLKCSISVDMYNNGPADLLIIIPMTSKKKFIPSHIEVKLAGLKDVSYVMCDQIRCISKERILGAEKVAIIDEMMMEDVERCLRTLLGFN
jgi:mRNA interferase MazF